MVIGSLSIDGTTHTGTAVGSIAAVAIARGSPGNEAGEDAVNDGLAVGIGPWLEACVSDVRLAVEAELLSVIVSGLVFGVGH